MSIGVDVVDIERLRAVIAREPAIRERLFTRSELGYCDTKPDPVRHLAGTLAAKEAVIKALRLGNLVAWSRRIEVGRADSGAPSATVETEAGVRAVEVSISHEGGVAVAIATR